MYVLAMILVKIVEMFCTRAHVPHAHITQSVATEMEISASKSCVSIHFHDLYQCILGQLVVCMSGNFTAACIMHWVGTVDGHGYGDQQKALLVTLLDHVSRSEAYWSHFFTKIICLQVTQVPRARDVAIFVLMTTTTMTTAMTGPIACALICPLSKW